MAPPRQRTAAIVDDSRSEASSGAREYRNTAPKRKTAGAAKEKSSVTSIPVTQEQNTEDQPRLPWSDLPLEILHAYRHAHKLPTPSAFSNEYSRILLTQGIGLRSPTALAARRAQSSAQRRHERDATGNRDRHNHGVNGTSGSHSTSNSNPGSNTDSSSVEDSSLHRIIGQDRVGKDQIALVVRRHFNSAGLSEQESIARFLYTVREERTGRQFRLRFQP